MLANADTAVVGRRIASVVPPGLWWMSAVDSWNEVAERRDHVTWVIHVFGEQLNIVTRRLWATF